MNGDRRRDGARDGVDGAAATYREVVERIEGAAVVERDVLFTVLAAVVSRGHVLLEDVPGTGKTVTARVLAEALGLEFGRIQFTPDLLPADVTGSYVYNEHDRSFEFSEGPVFTNVLLADEINRAPPKTQAALLEVMEERQVTVDGTTHDLPEPFVVVATQNPIEQEGTFRLPEAQRDRFSAKTSLGYPGVEGELELLDRRANRRTLAPHVEPAVRPARLRELQELAEDVRVSDQVRRYIVDVAHETREDDRTEVGVSPRGIQRVFETARAAAVLDGRGFVVPDDVKRLAGPAMAHRLVLTTEATVEGVDPRAVVRDALDAVDVPGVSPDAPSAGPSADDRPGEPPADGRPAETTTDGHSAETTTDGHSAETTTDGHSVETTTDGRPAETAADDSPPGTGADEALADDARGDATVGEEAAAADPEPEPEPHEDRP